MCEVARGLSSVKSLPPNSQDLDEEGCVIRTTKLILHIVKRRKEMKRLRFQVRSSDAEVDLFRVM